MRSSSRGVGGSVNSLQQVNESEIFRTLPFYDPWALKNSFIDTALEFYSFGEYIGPHSRFAYFRNKNILPPGNLSISQSTSARVPMIRPILKPVFLNTLTLRPPVPHLSPILSDAYIHWTNFTHWDSELRPFNLPFRDTRLFQIPQTSSLDPIFLFSTTKARFSSKISVPACPRNVFGTYCNPSIGGN